MGVIGVWICSVAQNFLLIRWGMFGGSNLIGRFCFLGAGTFRGLLIGQVSRVQSSKFSPFWAVFTLLFLRKTLLRAWGGGLTGRWWFRKRKPIACGYICYHLYNLVSLERIWLCGRYFRTSRQLLVEVGLHLFLLENLKAISMLTVECADSAAAADPFLEDVGYHTLQRHSSSSHLCNALVGAEAFSNFKLVDVQHRDEAHPGILALLYFAECKHRHTLKMLATDLAQQRHLVWICARNWAELSFHWKF